MQTAVPAGVGAMAAILKLPEGKLDGILEEAAQGEVVTAANFNSPDQVVIAGMPALWSVCRGAAFHSKRPVAHSGSGERKTDPTAAASADHGRGGWPAVVGTAWNGVVAPAGTPKAIVDTLAHEIGRSLNAADVKIDSRPRGWRPSAARPKSSALFSKRKPRSGRK